MQMGPTSLSTPLSPTRGLLFWRTIRGALGIRCLTFDKSKDLVTGARAGIRFPLPAVSALSGRSPPVLYLPFGGTETDHPYWPSGFERLDFRLAPSFHPSTFCRMSGLTGGIAIAFFSSNLACFWPKPSACPISKTAWTVSTASVVLKNLSEISSLEPDFFGGFSPFRCLETAPEE